MSSEVWVTLDAYPTLLAANLAAAIGPAGGPGFISPGYATRPPTSIEATGTSTSVIGSSTAVATTTWGVTASQITDWVTLTGTSTNPTQPFDAVLATMVFVTLPSYSILVPTNLIAGYASATMTAVSGTPSSTLASNCTATHAPQNNSGLVSKGEVAGVGVAFGLVAVLVAALAIWREMTWRRKSGRQVNSLPMQNSKARGPWLRSTAFNDDTLLGHQMTDYEVSAAVHQLLDDTKTWVQQLPLSSTPAVVTSLRDVQDTDRVMSVLPQLRRIEDLPQYVSDRRRLRSFIRGLVGLTVVESMFGNDGPKKRGESGRDHWLPTDIDTSVGALEAALLLQASPPKTTAPSQNRALDLKNFHEWRVATFSLLAKLYGESSTSWPDDAHVVSSFFLPACFTHDQMAQGVQSPCQSFHVLDPAILSREVSKSVELPISK